jgi:hypothetical protein
LRHALAWLEMPDIPPACTTPIPLVPIVNAPN